MVRQILEGLPPSFTLISMMAYIINSGDSTRGNIDREEVDSVH